MAVGSSLPSGTDPDERKENMKKKVSNNKLLEKYFETIDYDDYSLTPDDDEWWDDMGPSQEAEVCSLCSTAIEGGRNNQVKHLYENHYDVIKKDIL